MRLVPAALSSLLAAAALALSAAAQDAPPADAPQAPPAPRATEWTSDVLDARIPLRDGGALAADVFLPAKPGRYPAIVVQTPYDRRRLRAGLAPGATLLGEAAAEPISNLVDREHYAYVVADWRGFFGSRTTAGAARPGSLGRDGYDVVEWTAAQAWCDGKVGTWGPSALGVVQFQTAVERPPHLVCAVPVVASHGYRYDDYFSDGVLREHHVASLDRLGFGTGRVARDARDPDLPIYRLARAAERTAQIDVPVLMITGWFDHGIARQIDTFHALRASAGPRARAESRLVVGPWHHTAVDQVQQGDVQFPLGAGEAGLAAIVWFDKWLRGVGNGGWRDGERVRHLPVGGEMWLRTAEWPRSGGTERTLTLHGDGTLAFDTARADEPVRAFTDDPAAPVPTVGGANLPLAGLAAGPRDQKPLLARKDVLVYTTEPLLQPLWIEGAPRLSVWIRTDAPDTDVAVRLCAIDALGAAGATDGRSILLSDSIARASYAGPLEKGVAREVTVRLPPIAATFPVGARLRLIVSGTNSPRFERNDHTGRGGAFDPGRAVPATVEVLHDAAHPARLVVPVAP